MTGDRGLLTTRLLAEAARDLIVNGEALYKLDVNPLTGAVRLLRATSYSVYGADPDPATWRVQPESLWADREQDDRRELRTEVLHVRVFATLTGLSVARAVSPLRLASATGALTARLTDALGPRGGGGRRSNYARCHRARVRPCRTRSGT